MNGKHHLMVPAAHTQNQQVYWLAQRLCGHLQVLAAPSPQLGGSGLENLYLRSVTSVGQQAPACWGSGVWALAPACQFT